MALHKHDRPAKTTEAHVKRTSSWVAATLVVFGFLAGGLLVPARALERIKISVPIASTTFAPLYHAQAAGYFADEGLAVEIVVIPGPASLQVVIAGDAQFALIPGTYQLMAYEKGQRLPAVMSVLTRNSINIVMHKEAARAKGITDKTPLAEKIRALKGLKLAGSTPGGLSHQMLVYYALKAGFNPQKDVEIVGLGTDPARLAALEQRQVDAVATASPSPETAVSRGFGIMVVDNAAGEDPDFAEFMMDVLVTPSETISQRPELVRKVVRALLKSNAWLLDHPAEQGVPFMKPTLGRHDDTVILTGLQKTRLGIPRDGRVTERAATLTQEFLRKVGALKTVIPYDQLVTHEFLPR
jgi:NitT/TauT family transport system substrate-binding protein